MAKRKTVKKATKVRTLPARKTRNVKGGSFESGFAKGAQSSLGTMISNVLEMMHDTDKKIIGNLRS